MLDTPLPDDQLTELKEKLAALTAANATLASEREEYRKLYLDTLALCRKLELGILGQKRERLSPADTQLALALLGTLLAGGAPGSSPEPAAAPPVGVESHTRRRPTGRKPLPETLPRVDVEVLPPEVKEQGLAAFERIGEDVTETVERRPASLVVVRVVRPKFVEKGRERLAETVVMQAPTPELPIERGLAGPGLLSDTVVRRWLDHLPLHRLERIYGREGLDLARSTICGWHAELATLAQPLIEAMWADAMQAAYLCTDATGVLVQASERCRRGHFFVVVAPERHVLFGYSPKHDSAAVDELLGGFKGHLVADAHAVYDHLYRKGDVIEVACWAHSRRYFWKALESDRERSRHALALIGEIFRIEREIAKNPPERKLAVRQAQTKPIVDAFFAWCDAQDPHLLDETPISKAITYARNQRQALQRFLENGRLPAHNNWSERELRREALGRKNWIFLGSDEGGDINATFVTLLASCQMHRIEPWAYLRDLLCLLPNWPRRRVLHLAPAYWKKTAEHQDTQQRLAGNIFRPVTFGVGNEHRQDK